MVRMVGDSPANDVAFGKAAGAATASAGAPVCVRYARVARITEPTSASSPPTPSHPPAHPSPILRRARPARVCLVVRRVSELLLSGSPGGREHGQMGGALPVEADLWSLGTLMFQLLTLARPFEGAQPNWQ